MAKYQFTSTHGVVFSEDGSNPWASFARTGEGAYVFETDSADVAARLRKVDDYGIAEVKAAKPSKAGS